MVKNSDYKHAQFLGAVEKNTQITTQLLLKYLGIEQL